MLFWLYKTKRLEIYFSMSVFTKLTKFSLKCILEFTRIPLQALRLRAAYDTLMAAMVVAGIVS